MSHIKIVYGDDWECLYENDQEVTQGHQLRNFYWYELGRRNPEIIFDDIEFYEVDDQWLEDNGNFPSNFNEIPKDKLKE